MMAALLVAGGAYAYTASNTVPTSNAGAGSGAVSGYAVADIHYTLDTTVPNDVDALTFTVSPAIPISSGGTVVVQARLATGGPTTYRCTTTSVGTVVTCSTTSPQLTADGLVDLTVVAAQTGIAGAAGTGATDPTSGPGPTLAIAAPPEAAVYASYVMALSASGGAAPYAWAISGGDLPVGITLDPSTGVLGGIPTRGGTSSFTVSVIDAVGRTAHQGTSITVNATISSWTKPRGGNLITTYPDGRVDMIVVGGERRILGGPATATNYTVTSNATLVSGAGYGLYLRATVDAASKLTGYCVQFDHTYGQLVVRQLQADLELSTPIARVPPPTGLVWYGTPHRITATMAGNSMTVALDGTQVLSIPDLAASSAAAAKTSSGITTPITPPVTGGFGIRAWSDGVVALHQMTSGD